jgi:hypothetical protein
VPQRALERIPVEPLHPEGRQNLEYLLLQSVVARLFLVLETQPELFETYPLGIGKAEAIYSKQDILI